MSDQLSETGRRLAAHGHDLDTIALHLKQAFPGTPELEMAYVLRGIACTTAPIPPPPPASPSCDDRPYAPVEPTTPKPAVPKVTRDKYIWQSMPEAKLPKDVQSVRTLIPAKLAGVINLFNGKPNASADYDWGRGELEGTLTSQHVKLVIAFWQLTQEADENVASGCLAVECSIRKLYMMCTPGVYGGSGCRRFKRLLEELHDTYLRTKDAKGYFHSRIIASYEFVSAPSGKRLIIRFGQAFTDVMRAPNHIGCKPVELEPVKKLRGRDLIAYMMFDYMAANHDTGLIGIKKVADRLNVQGSEAKQARQVSEMIKRLDGLVISRRKKPSEACEKSLLKLRIEKKNIRYERINVPAAST